jgi:hypothetical protein
MKIAPVYVRRQPNHARDRSGPNGPAAPRYLRMARRPCCPRKTMGVSTPLSTPQMRRQISGERAAEQRQ